jgi:spore maturation protein CgeB
MRIFSAVRHSADPAFYYGGLWSRNFYPALRRLGHEVVESVVDLRPASDFMELATPHDDEVARRARDRISERLVDEVRRAHRAQPIDLFLAYFYNSHCTPEAILEIRALGIPTVNFYCNSIYQFELVAEIAPSFDYSWHAERDAAQRYRDVGANPVWVQMGADPDLYHPVPTVARQPAACFIGQRYADRAEWLATLVRAQVPVAVFGSGWVIKPTTDGRSAAAPAPEHPARSTPGSAASYLGAFRSNMKRLGWGNGLLRSARMARRALAERRRASLLGPHVHGHAPSVAGTCGQYEVVLNFSNVWADGRTGSRLIPHVRLRDFEGPMCRSCYLTGHTDEIEEFYDVGREIDTYRTPAELVDKTRFYLSNSGAAERLRAAGYERARRDHTWDQRFRALFSRIGARSR